MFLLRCVGLLAVLTLGGFTTLLSDSWGITGPPTKINAFRNQSFGAPSLGDALEDQGKQADPKSLAAWNRLKSSKIATNSTIDFSPRTGLPHSVAYLQAPVTGQSLQEKAWKFLHEQKDLLLKGNEPSDLVFEKERRSSSGAAHLDFLQTYQGRRIYGAGLTVHFDSAETIVMVNGEYLPDLVIANEEYGSELSSEQALNLALKRFGKLGKTFRSAGEPEKVVYSISPAKGANYLAYRYDLLGPEPDSVFVLFVDASTGMVLAFFPTITYLDGSAMLYDPNPAQSGLVQRTLTDLDDSGKLRGPLVVVLDEENDRVDSPFRTFNSPPNTPGFRQASVYYYLTETRKRLRALGFDDSAAGTLPASVDALDQKTGNPFNNAFFNPLGGGFVFGNGDGNIFTNLAQDFDVAAHEFGHFFDDHLINTEQTPLHTPRRAWGEACGDTIAAIINGDPNVGESSVPGKPFLRTLKNTKRYPNDLVNEEHLDGEIFAGANWDFMMLRGGGTVTQAARDEMASVLIAGIPFIPMTNVQYSDILKAFVQGDMGRGETNVSNLRSAFGTHGIAETGVFKQSQARQGAARVKGVAGFQELQNGVPVVGTLFDGFFADFFIRVPAGSTRLTVQTFPPKFPEFGDVILRVAPGNYTNNDQVVSVDAAFVQETIVVTNSSPVPLSTDNVWLIEVQDFQNGFLSEVGLVATIEGSDGQIQQIFFDKAVNGRIEDLNEKDGFYFQGTAQQVIELSVAQRGDFELDPLVLLGNSAGQLLAFDDDSGGGLDALISGFTLPADDNYLVVVMSAITDLGPTSFGDYRLLLSTGTLPPPTPTPGPTPVPGGVTTLTSGIPVTGTIGPKDQATGIGASSDPFKIAVPAGARDLVIRVNESPVPAGSFILQVRKGQPVGNNLDDYIGLGSRKSTVVITPTSRVPLSPETFFMQFFNFADTTQTFSLVATIDGGDVPGAEYDRIDDGEINAEDLISLIQSNPTNVQTFLDFAKYWQKTGL